MEIIKKFIILTTAISFLFAGQIDAQPAPPATECCRTDAYDDCNRAAIWSAALPIGAIVVAAIIIATSSHHHHHHSSYSSYYSGCKSRSSYYSTGHSTHCR